MNLITNSMNISSIEASKHSFAIKPYLPSKRRELNTASNSLSPIINRSQNQRINNGSKSLRTKKQNLSSARSREKQMNQIKPSLIKAQSSYQGLKKMYKKLKLDNEQFESKSRQMEQENLRLKQQVEQYKQQNIFFQQEFQRIKKQCFKLLEIQSFKNKKMEQTLQQKELMIQYLKGQISKNTQINCNYTTSFTILQNQFSNPLNHYRQNSAQNNCNLSLASLQDILAMEAQEKDRFMSSNSEKDDISLNFSKDKSNLIQTQQHKSTKKLIQLPIESSVQAFQNISFALNKPQFNNNNKIFKKRKNLQIAVQNISTIENQSALRKGSSNSKTHRKKSEADHKVNKNIKSKCDIIQQRRGVNVIR